MVQPQAAVTADYAYITTDEAFLTVETLRYVKGITQVQYRTTLGPDSFMLTPSKLYNNTAVNTETRAKSPEVLTFSDAPGHLRTEYLKKRDISGQDVFATVYPDIREYYKFLQSQHVVLDTANPIVNAYLKAVQSFPAGSTCYVMDRAEANQGYIRFERNGDTGYGYQEFLGILEEWAKDSAADNQWTYRVSSGTWAGYEWKYVQFFDKHDILHDDVVVVNYQGNAYEGEMSDFENFSSGAQITKVKALITDTPAQTVDYYWYKSVLKNYEQGCVYYNITAAQALSLLK